MKYTKLRKAAADFHGVGYNSVTDDHIKAFQQTDEFKAMNDSDDIGNLDSETSEMSSAELRDMRRRFDALEKRNEQLTALLLANLQPNGDFEHDESKRYTEQQFYGEIEATKRELAAQPKKRVLIPIPPGVQLGEDGTSMFPVVINAVGFEIPRGEYCFVPQSVYEIVISDPSNGCIPENAEDAARFVPKPDRRLIEMQRIVAEGFGYGEPWRGDPDARLAAA